MKNSEYIICIDLGTTNCAMAFAHQKEVKKEKRPAINFFPVPQLAEKGEIIEQELLPSFVYIPGQYELPEGSYSLPWEKDTKFIVGEYAKKLGGLIPGRLVSSAKSWLCHGGVDRREKILPWQGGEEVNKISPLKASCEYLSHIRKTWNYKIAGGNRKKLFENQDIVITVPASFNDVARELTVEAAYMAGLENITLLEEPQAAFYSWLASFEGSLKRYLGKNRLVLVCDTGGGTTDFTLIQVDKKDGNPVLRRIAVGEHLLLGGDNMDIALATYVEKKLKENFKGKLDARQWGTLCQECQRAKEFLMTGEEVQDITITIPGSGSRIIGGMLQSRLSRNEIEEIVLEGFFPKMNMADLKKPSRVYGIQEWGLPYEKNPSITYHLASFLKAHSAGTGPDVVLFNGGSLKPYIITERLLEILNTWVAEDSKIQKPVKILPSKNMDLAVARGGVYYGLTRRGRGIRITGGIPRSYYVGIDREKGGNTKEELSLCLIPRDMEEGQEVIIKDKKFNLIVGRPISLPLYCSTTRKGDTSGKLLEVDFTEFSHLPPIFTVIKPEEDKKEVEVYLKARVTEVGTLELSCITQDEKESWKLEFNLRKGKDRDSSEKEKTIKIEKMEKVKNLIEETFNRKPGRVTGEDIKPRNLLYHIETKFTAKRYEWNTGVIRELWDALNRVKKRRRSNPEYEAYWFNATGFCLRPGFGYPLDDWRMEETWEIFPLWLQYNKEKQGRIEWWIFWRRIAAGLKKEWQEEVFDRISPYLFTGKKHIKPFPGPLPSSKERLEILRLAVSLEELEKSKKLSIAELILNRFEKEANHQNTFWLLARLGARIPFSASIHQTLGGEVVSFWIKEILKREWEDKNAAAFGLASMARFTGDRKRDISPELRDKVVKRMRKEKCQEVYIQPVETILEVKSEEKSMLFGESLPIGLKLAFSHQRSAFSTP